ncbi:MAG TPA: glycoside hydrolase family 2 TIM barrel-domain containing protein [Gemmatimonadaceae bacterium]
MKRPTVRSVGRLGIAAALLLAASGVAQAQSRVTRDFDAGWKFQLGDVSGGQDSSRDDSRWRALDLPHDWSIEGDFSETNPAGAGGGALPGGVGWYRKHFTVPASDSARLTFVEFDGVYRDSEVWINGHYLGKRPYGYSSFRYELTPYLRYGAQTNVIAVRVDDSKQPNSRWYSGSGIYRNVRLVSTGRVHVDQWGTYVTTPEVSARSARVSVRTTLRNATPGDRPVVLRTIIEDASGRTVASAAVSRVLPRDTIAEVAQELVVRQPALWSLERPAMYRVVSRVECGGRLCDEYATPLGIRRFEFRADSGFFLNGRHVKIRGVCLHHDLGALGAAVNVRALERQLRLMQAMGANAIRTSHNPPAPELLDLADRMGFVVMDEAFDMWRKQKTEFDYHLDFPEWHERDIADMVRRDRNHPSVFIWSIGNEVMEQWTDGDSTAAPIARELAGIVRRLDPTRPITSASNNGSSANPVFTSGALDLLGHNYHHEKWADFPTQFPGQKVIITEAMSAYNSRGFYEQPSDSVAVYFTPYDTTHGQKPNANHRISSYDNRRASWGSLHEESLRIFEAHPFLSGMFVWQGIDYLGEPTPYQWPARSSYFGLVDLAGFEKDPYFLYQSVWSARPMLHVFPHWNWKQGDTIDVWAYTNAGDEVELFLNGTSLGTKRKEGDVSHVWWRVPYAPGTLRAVARKGGRAVMTREVKTTGPAARVQLTPDRSAIRADGRDLSFVTVTVVDAHGVPVPDAEPLVHLKLTGGATIAGVDNGDQVSHERFQRDSVRLFAGKALVIVRPRHAGGTASLTATADGLQPATARLTMRAPR